MGIWLYEFVHLVLDGAKTISFLIRKCLQQSNTLCTKRSRSLSWSNRCNAFIYRVLNIWIVIGNWSILFELKNECTISQRNPNFSLRASWENIQSTIFTSLWITLVEKRKTSWLYSIAHSHSFNFFWPQYFENRICILQPSLNLEL